MGRSPSSCLKIIACGSDTAENDDIDAPEAKVSGDKRGWSFRKKSGRHRVVGNNVNSEPLTFADKEIPQGVNTDFQQQAKSFGADEKPPLPKSLEKIAQEIKIIEHSGESKTPVAMAASENHSSTTLAEPELLPAVVASENKSRTTSAELETATAEKLIASESGHGTPAELKTATAAVVSESLNSMTLAEPKMADAKAVSETDDDTVSAKIPVPESVDSSENNGDIHVNDDEPVAIVIQTAIRGFLAQRELLQLKSVVKLQAAVRGHLVRRDAVETLHCIRAIVKFQSLVRARSSNNLDQKNKPNVQFSTVKLLQNSFARQLLVSAPKSKPVNVRCDPLKPDVAWGWLERWMSVSTPEVAEKLEPSLESEDVNQFQETAPEGELESPLNQVQKTAPQADLESRSMVRFQSVASKFSSDEEDDSVEDKEDDITHDVKIGDSQSRDPLSVEEKTEQPDSEETEIFHGTVDSDKVDMQLNEISLSQEEQIFPPLENSAGSEQPKISTKQLQSEELEGQGKKFVTGSRKSINPVFVAAKSKFEELSSAGSSGRSSSLPHQEVGTESHVDTASSAEESYKNSIEPSVAEIPATDPLVHVTVSECGTELSISSTLDSPDRSDYGNAEAPQENEVLEETSHPHTGEETPDCENGKLNYFVNDLPIPNEQEEVHMSNGVSVAPVEADACSHSEQKVERDISESPANLEPVNSATDALQSQMQQEHELNGHDVQVEDGHGTEHQPYKASPEASPKSHKTFPESQGTPSSQVSVKSRRNKIDKSGSKAKRNSLSTGKKSVPNATPDSGTRSSSEQLPKDHRSGKRRNSFGSTKSDNADQEARESSSRSSLPSYMQATESARAKAHSPRSSPDVNDKEVYSKKRHSLPGANGRQGSPRIQRSSSQAAQGEKANGSLPSNERKWQR